MTLEVFSGELSAEIRQIYRADPTQAEASITSFLEQHLQSLPSDDRFPVLDALITEFELDANKESKSSEMEDEILSRIFSLLLGRDVSQADLSSTEVIQRLAESINTVFDTLNQVIKVINATLFSECDDDKTIRFMIGSHLEKGSQTKSLESYLGQIQKAFLTTQQAFKNAAFARVREILEELDPQKISVAGGGLKFGPLRKAELFDIYERKFQTCRKWFESGRFMEAFLQEFEKNCRKLAE